MFRNRFLPHVHDLQVNPLRNSTNSSIVSVTQSELLNLKPFYFYCFERILFSVKPFVEGKFVYGENLSSGKLAHWGKFL